MKRSILRRCRQANAAQAVCVTYLWLQVAGYSTAFDVSAVGGSSFEFVTVSGWRGGMRFMWRVTARDFGGR